MCSWDRLFVLRANENQLWHLSMITCKIFFVLQGILFNVGVFCNQHDLFVFVAPLTTYFSVLSKI